MPIYEYRCEQCGQILEVHQKMSDPRLTDCPACQDGRLVRILSLVNVGSGASGRQAASCTAAPEPVPSCQMCGKAGTGCS